MTALLDAECSMNMMFQKKTLEFPLMNEAILLFRANSWIGIHVKMEATSRILLRIFLSL